MLFRRPRSTDDRIAQAKLALGVILCITNLSALISNICILQNTCNKTYEYQVLIVLSVVGLCASLVTALLGMWVKLPSQLNSRMEIASISRNKEAEARDKEFDYRFRVCGNV